MVFSGKQCTEYGISSTAARMASVVLLDEKQILPVATRLEGEYGESGIFIGVPAVVGAGGAEQVVEIPMSVEELAEFRRCCDDVRANMAHALEIR